MPVYISQLHERPEYNNRKTAYMVADKLSELNDMLKLLKIDSSKEYRKENKLGLSVIVLSEDERRKAFCYYQARLCSEEEFLKRIGYIKKYKR